jgi:hypothetical protein
MLRIFGPDHRPADVPCPRASGRVRVASALALLAYLALAMPARPAHADGDDAAATRALIQATVSLDTPGVAAVTAEAIERANDALERATRLRAAGDLPHAKVADGLAHEWAETARDAALAAAAERLADDRKRQAIQTQAQLQRTKALVEESIARLGRLRAALEAATPGVANGRRDSAKGKTP